jgi:hypothetical protein
MIGYIEIFQHMGRKYDQIRVTACSASSAEVKTLISEKQRIEWSFQRLGSV